MNIAAKKKFDIEVFALKIRQIRGELTQEQFARILGVSRTKVSRWEDGKFEPSVSELHAIAVFAGCSIDEVVYGHGVELPSKISNDLENLAERIAEATVERITVELRCFLASSPLNNGNVSKKGCDKMPIYLSNLAQIRLRPLLRESLIDKGLQGEYLQAAHAAGLEGEQAQLLAALLKLICDKGLNLGYGYPKSFLDAIAYLCCQVETWRSDTDPDIIPNSFHPDRDALIKTLERAVGNHKSSVCLNS